MNNYLIDLDGTLYKGQTKVDYADIFVNYLNKNNRKYLFVTNCPLNSPKIIAEKLKKMGIDADCDSVLTSGMVCSDYLLKKQYGKSIYVIGSPALKCELNKAGFELVENNPDVVVVGYDKDFTYEKMEKASISIRAGAVFVGTNIDNTIPYGNTFVPHTGSILASIIAATDKVPICIGKPSEFMLYSAIKKLDCQKNDCVVIGDRLDTDILFAVNNGIPGFLVLTGTTDLKMLAQSEIKPEKVFNNLNDIIEFESRDAL